MADGLHPLAAKPKDEGCFLCDAAKATTDAERRQRLVLWATDHTIVLMNRFPYTNGHLMIAPRLHKANSTSFLRPSNSISNNNRRRRDAAQTRGVGARF